MSTVMVSGLIAGSLYALIGAGIVLVYRQARILNFAHGAVATLCSYVAWDLLERGMSYAVAAAIAILLGAVLQMLLELFVVRPMRGADEFAIGVAALGVGLLMLGYIVLQWGNNPRQLRGPIESSWTIQVFGVTVGSTAVVSIAVTLLAFALLWFLIEHTRFGLSMRAVSEGPVTAGMLGINVGLISLLTWGLGGALAAIAGLLVSAQHGLSPDFLTTLKIISFAGIVLGGIESIRGALLGGFLFGIISSLVSFYITGRLTHVVALVMIIIVLALRPHGLFGTELHHVAEPTIGRRRLGGGLLSLRLPSFSIRPAVGYVAVAVAVVVALAVPWVFGTSTVFNLALVAAMFPAVLGQNVVSGYAGQPSIAQSGFMLIGAYTAALLTAKLGMPFGPTIVLAVVVSTISGIILALSAARLSGVYLVLITIAFALSLPQLAGLPRDLTGGADGLSFPTQQLFGFALTGGTRAYVFVTCVSLLTAGVFYLAARAAPGRRWRAVRDSEAGAASIGISVPRVKIATMGIAGGLAGLGGILNILLIGYLAPTSFNLWVAIFLLAAVIIGGVGTIRGSLIGAAFIVLTPIYLAVLPHLTDVIFGAAIIGTLLFAPEGLAQLVNVRRRRRLPTERGALAATPVVADPPVDREGADVAI